MAILSSPSSRRFYTMAGDVTKPFGTADDFSRKIILRKVGLPPFDGTLLGKYGWLSWVEE